MKSMSASAAVLALRASCAALRGNFSAIASNAAGFRSILLAQGSLLHRAREAGAKPALLHAADASLRAVLSGQPDASPKYSAALLSLETPGVEMCALAGALLDPRAAHNKAAVPRSVRKSKVEKRPPPAEPPPPPPPREKWLTFYASAVLGAASPPSAHVHAGFAPPACEGHHRGVERRAAAGRAQGAQAHTGCSCGVTRRSARLASA